MHLGPIGVAPEAQGQGIGTALMNRYIEHLKQERSAGYLETDRPENVEFYKKFGFVGPASRATHRHNDLVHVAAPVTAKCKSDRWLSKRSLTTKLQISEFLVSLSVGNFRP